MSWKVLFPIDSHKNSFQEKQSASPKNGCWPPLFEGASWFRRTKEWYDKIWEILNWKLQNIRATLKSLPTLPQSPKLFLQTFCFRVCTALAAHILLAPHTAAKAKVHLPWSMCNISFPSSAPAICLCLQCSTQLLFERYFLLSVRSQRSNWASLA